MPAAITLSHITKQYPGTSKPSVKDLSIAVSAGEVYGFLGSNGAGKSTTIRMLLNFLQPTSGTASILGKDSVKDSVELKQYMGYLAGDVALYNNVTGAQFLNYIGRLQGLKDTTYLKTLTKRFEAELSKKIGDLSKGNRQKIGILQAAMHQPDVLILDEPTSGLDPLMQERFYETIAEAKARGAAVFLSSHSLDEVEHICDRVGIIRHGVLVREGTLAEVAGGKQQPTFVVTLAKQPPAALTKSAAIKVINIAGNSITVQSKKDLASLLAVLSKYEVVNLQSQQAELETEFMNFYQDEEASA